MLSWNYWISYSDILAASPDGRAKGKFLSNAICPSNGADIKGPTANVNSVGRVMGGKASDGKGDWGEYINVLPNGGSHTITFNPSILRDPEHRAKFKAFLRGYIENGGSALQINMLNADLLRDAQKTSRRLPPSAGARDRIQRLLHHHWQGTAGRDYRPRKPPDGLTGS